MKKAVK